MDTTDLTPRMIAMIDWVRRTGWPTYARDHDWATRVFDAWWVQTIQLKQQGDARDRRLLVEALAEVFGDVHDAEVVEHLCVFYTTVFEAHIRSREIT